MSFVGGYLTKNKKERKKKVTRVGFEPTPFRITVRSYINCFIYILNLLILLV